MKKIWLICALLMQIGISAFAQESQNSTQQVSSEATEWIAVKESSLDSVTLSYYKAKGIINYSTPKNNNNSVFLSVAGFMADLLDKTISSISKNTNKFYDTPVGFWVTWGVFYHYVGKEVVAYVWLSIYLVLITGLFLWLWNKYCIPRTVAIKPDREDLSQPAPLTLQYEIKKTNVPFQIIFLIVYLILFAIGTFNM